MSASVKRPDRSLSILSCKRQLVALRRLGDITVSLGSPSGSGDMESQKLHW